MVYYKILHDLTDILVVRYISGVFFLPGFDNFICLIVLGDGG